MLHNKHLIACSNIVFELLVRVPNTKVWVLLSIFGVGTRYIEKAKGMAILLARIIQGLSLFI